MMKHNLLL